MITTRINFKPENLIRIKTRKLLLLLFVLLSATSEAASKNATEITQLGALNTNKFVSSSEPTPPPSSTANTGSYLSDIYYAWGHNTKYSTIMFDENITVKGSTWLAVKYPTNDDLSNEYTIIGIYTFATDKLHFSGKDNSTNMVSVLIVEGGVDRNFATIRFESKTSDDIEFNLKIFGINV